jgi:hypothetical protein
VLHENDGACLSKIDADNFALTWIPYLLVPASKDQVTCLEPHEAEADLMI